MWRATKTRQAANSLVPGGKIVIERYAQLLNPPTSLLGLNVVRKNERNRGVTRALVSWAAVLVVTEHFNGCGFVVNPDDGDGVTACTQIAPALLLSAPGVGNTGRVSIDVDLSTMPWLQFDWTGRGSQGRSSGRGRIAYPVSETAGPPPPRRVERVPACYGRRIQ